MTDYSNQNITGTNLTSADLSGANFTNTNATSVNFTNANITNANFTNTLITSATLTGITFSNVQKGQLLLRAANITNSAVNNLSSLTISELRRVQSAISLRSLNLIQSITVAIPNSGGAGYTVSITPSLTQAVCIFVAVNQNVVLTSSSVNVRTIRNNGTVIQDMDSSSATINHLKIGTVPYSISIGNGNGVILLVPINMNMLKVNESGISDLLSLNTTNTIHNLYWGNGSSTTSKVLFSLGTSYDLRYYKLRCMARIRTNYTFQYPLLVFNQTHSFPSANNYTNEMSSNQGLYQNTQGYNSGNNGYGNVVHYEYQDRSMCFMTIPPPNNVNVEYFFILNFEIDSAGYDTAANVQRQLVAKGTWTMVSKTIGQLADYKYTATFERSCDETSISRIGFCGYNNESTAIKSCDLRVEVVPLGSYTTQSSNIV